MSAPRTDSRLRTQFEYAQILKRYRAIDSAVLLEIFADDLAVRGIDANLAPDIWLAELALKTQSPPHRLFAVDTLFETARSDIDLHRLRNIAGEADVFGILATAERDARLAERDARLAEHAEAIARYDNLARAHENEIRRLQQEVAIRDASIHELMNSRSWRYTAPLRHAVRMLRPGTDNTR